MTKILSAAFITCLLILNSAIAGPTLTPEVKALLSDAKKTVAGVSVNKLKSIIKADSAILIDVRDPNEWEKGVIKTNRLVKISRGFMEIKYPKLILNQYKKSDPFVVYCALAPRSILAAKRLQQLGFTNVSYLEGGIKAFNAHK